MLVNLKELEQYEVSAVDGEIGSVVDVLFDDLRWTVRYLVVTPGEWLKTRRVLLPTATFRSPDTATRRFAVALTVDQVRHSPSIDTDAPVSRYHERLQAQHYGLPYYWNSAGFVGLGLYPGMAAFAGFKAAGDVANADESPDHDVHLRSAKEVRRYHVQGIDDSVGHIEGFIADQDNWEVKYLVVDTSNWWFGKKVLIAPRFATEIDWNKRMVRISMSRHAIKDSPKWDEAIGINDEYAARLDDYYKSALAGQGNDGHHGGT